MKILGICMMALALVLAISGAAIYSSPPNQSDSMDTQIKYSTMAMDSCHALQATDIYSGNHTDCSVEEQKVSAHQAESMTQAATPVIAALTMIGLAPLLFLIGVVLYAAGRAAEIVVAAIAKSAAPSA